jgi:orotidine-5'-phosphate decarboxylase
MGGRAMLEAACAALGSRSERPLLIAVTVLTSLAAQDLEDVGLQEVPAALVLRLAGLAQATGLDGVVCSPREVPALRSRFGPGFKLVTPGVRPSGAAADDQQRIATPGQAIAAGADYLVIGRPVTRAPDPIQALRTMDAEVAAALREARS